MLTEFDERGVAQLQCYDTDSWEYSEPVGLGSSGRYYRRKITLGKITIWGSVFEK